MSIHTNELNELPNQLSYVKYQYLAVCLGEINFQWHTQLNKQIYKIITRKLILGTAKLIFDDSIAFMQYISDMYIFFI